MKFASLAVALCLVASAVADFDYAGSTVLGTRWNAPTYTLDTNTGAIASCVASNPAIDTQYQAFNASFTTATFIRLLALFEKDFRSTSQILVYNAATFAPATNPCTGLVMGIRSASSGLAIDSPAYVPAGTYTVVITGSATNATGLFAVNALVASVTGSTQGRNTTWFPINSGSPTNDCTDVSSTATSYISYTWTANATGEFDIEAFAMNATFGSGFYTTVAVFHGSFPNASLNVTGPAYPCNGSLLWGQYTSGYAGGVFRVPLTAGQQYTAVASGYGADEVGIFGIFIGVTRYGNTSAQTQTFNAPTVPATGTTPNCTLGGTQKYYQNVVFQAAHPVYIIDTDQGFDAATFLYDGAYTTAPPSNCTGFIFAGDTGDGGPIAVVVVPGRNYTAVVTGYSSGAGSYSIYILTGTPLGVPTVTTTGSATAGVTTAATTGSATSTVASLVLVVIAAILAML